MYTIFTGIIISIVFSIAMMIIHEECREDIDGIGGIILGPLILSFFISVITAACLPSRGFKKEADWTINLESMTDNSETQGSFCLGSGTVDGVMMFRYYHKSNGVYVYGQKYAKQSYVTYSDDGKATLTKYSYTVNNPWSIGSSHERRYEFKIPPGSIKNQFKLDTQ